MDDFAKVDAPRKVMKRAEMEIVVETLQREMKRKAMKRTEMKIVVENLLRWIK